MTRARLRVAALFGFAGLSHLTFGRRFFEAIVPPWVPAPTRLVNQAAGVAELTGGALALIPGAERPARRYLVALLMAVFPANCHMAIRPADVGAERIPGWMLWARLPLQFVLIGWVLKALPSAAGSAEVQRPILFRFMVPRFAVRVTRRAAARGGWR